MPLDYNANDHAVEPAGAPSPAVSAGARPPMGPIDSAVMDPDGAADVADPAGARSTLARSPMGSAKGALVDYNADDDAVEPAGACPGAPNDGADQERLDGRRWR